MKHKPFVKRAYHGVGLINQVVYIFGGFNRCGDHGYYSSDTFAFNVLAQDWNAKSNMNEKRCYVSSAELGGYLYAIGGFNGTERLKSAERYDPKTNQWSFILL